jgi:hypothetical protein
VPKAQAPGSADGQGPAEEARDGSKDPAYDAALFDLSEQPPISDEATRLRDAPDGGPRETNELSKRAAVERVDPARPPGLPRPIDVILYPLNASGLIHLVGLWLLLFFLCPRVMSLGFGTEFVPLIYALPVAYALYYFAECIRDRSAGGRHVPDYWMHPGDSSKWDCLSQMFEVVGCIAVCFCPVSVYYIVREQVDLAYWLLLASGGFFFPMVLLAVVLFDSLSALNPLLIGGSILRTFFPYCGMALLFCGGALLSVKIGFPLNGFHPLPTVPFLLWLVQLYMIFVAIALLGGFYQWQKDRLDWEI